MNWRQISLPNIIVENIVKYHYGKFIPESKEAVTLIENIAMFPCQELSACRFS